MEFKKIPKDNSFNIKKLGTQENTDDLISKKVTPPITNCGIIFAGNITGQSNSGQDSGLFHYDHDNNTYTKIVDSAHPGTNLYTNNWRQSIGWWGNKLYTKSPGAGNSNRIWMYELDIPNFEAHRILTGLPSPNGMVIKPNNNTMGLTSGNGSPYAAIIDIGHGMDMIDKHTILCGSITHYTSLYPHNQWNSLAPAQSLITVDVGTALTSHHMIVSSQYIENNSPFNPPPGSQFVHILKVIDLIHFWENGNVLVSLVNASRNVTEPSILRLFDANGNVLDEASSTGIGPLGLYRHPVTLEVFGSGPGPQSSGGQDYIYPITFNPLNITSVPILNSNFQINDAAYFPCSFPPTWECSGSPNFICSDPGDGSGNYSSLNACQAACGPSTYDCDAMYNCIPVPFSSPTPGAYATLSDCEDYCVPPSWNCDLNTGCHQAPIPGPFGTYSSLQGCIDDCENSIWSCSLVPPTTAIP